MKAARKTALLIGINEYRKVRRLSGCENDVAEMEEILKEDYQFEIFRVLRSREATRDAILRALDDLALDLQGCEGGVALFHYSGHGSQMRDMSGEETDRYNETLVPHDRGREVADIADDEIFEKIMKIIGAAQGIQVVCSIDACHSGTILRGSAPEVRKAPVSEHIPPARPAPPWLGVAKGPSKWFPKNGSYVLMAACADNQTAKEDKYEDSPKPHGAFSYFLLQGLRAMRSTPDWTYQDLWERVAVKVNITVPSQTPQLEGAADWRVFCGNWRAPARYFEVTGITGNLATIKAGRCHGISVGTELSILCRSDTKEVTKKAVVRDKPGAGLSEAVMEGAPGPEFCLGRAEIISYGAGADEFRIPVAIDDELPEDLKTGVSRSRLARHEPQIGRSKVWIRAGKGGNIWLCGPDGYLLRGEPFNIHRDGLASEIVETLEQIARYYNLVGLENRDADPEVNPKTVRLELRRVQDGEDRGALERTDGGQIAIQVGESVRIEIVKTCLQNLYASVLHLGADGGIEILYPGVGVTDYLIKEERTALGTFRAASPPGRSRLKLIATGQPADYRMFLQPGLANLTLRGPRRNFPDYFSAVVNGLPGLRKKLKLARGDIWTTHTLEYWVVDRENPVRVLQTSLLRPCPDLAEEQA